MTTKTGIYGVVGSDNNSATFEELKLQITGSKKPCAQGANLGVEVGPPGTEGHTSVVDLPLVSKGQGVCDYDGSVSPIEYPSLQENVIVTALNSGRYGDLGLRKSELLKHPGPTTDNWTERDMPQIPFLPFTVGD